ncbi:hypothetical protein ACFL6C_02485 [Myxococcota bacterium]
MKPHPRRFGFFRLGLVLAVGGLLFVGCSSAEITGTRGETGDADGDQIGWEGGDGPRGGDDGRDGNGDPSPRDGDGDERRSGDFGDPMESDSPGDSDGPGPSHPFLLIRAEDFAELQSRAAASPWSDMRASVWNDFQNSFYDPQAPTETEEEILAAADGMAEVYETGALAYVLYPQERAAIVQKLYDTLLAWQDLSEDWAAHRDTHGWTVKVGTVFLHAMLALDVIHDGLTSEQRGLVEQTLYQSFVQWHQENLAPWAAATYAIRGIWHLYGGDFVQADVAIQDYMAHLEYLITEDGVFIGGPGYGVSRFGTERHIKHIFMDILENTGRASPFDDPRMRRFHEWMYGYATSPNRYRYSFADSPPRPWDPIFPVVARADKLGETARGFAAWHLHEILEGIPNPTPPARFLWYVLYRENVLSWDVRLPQTRIFKDGGGWLIQQTPDPDQFDQALAGVLWNCMSDSHHTHKDVNSINVSAFGEPLIVNVGYNGWGEGWGGFPWGYVRDFAESSNVVLIDDQDHVFKYGDGVEEGFSAPYLDYVSAVASETLGNGLHTRSLLLVHPRPGLAGYFALLDEVEASDAAVHTVTVVLHPNSDQSPIIVTPDIEAQWTVSPYPAHSSHPVHLSIFLATPQDSNAIVDGLLANWDESFIGKYLRSDYATDSSGSKNIVTLLFPWDAEHAKPDGTRVQGSGYTGAVVALDLSTQDVVLESDGSAPVTYGGVTFGGKAAAFRLVSEQVSSYFVRQGNTFDSGDAGRVGFESDQALSIALETTEGTVHVHTPGVLRVFFPAIRAIQVDGVEAPVLQSGSGWLEISIDQGTHDLVIVTA